MSRAPERGEPVGPSSPGFHDLRPTVTGPLDRLRRGASAILGRSLTDEEAELFSKYLTVLTKWQKIHRLIGSSEPEWIVENLFLDSLLFLKVLPTGIQRLADLGSGAGVPGIPLKIVLRDVEVSLIESRQRRASFLSTAVRELRLTGVDVLNARVEKVADGFTPRFDAVVMRCAGDPENLILAAMRLLVPRGVVIASGSPTPKPLSIGRWVSVAGVRPGSIRHFALATAH